LAAALTSSAQFYQHLGRWWGKGGFVAGKFSIGSPLILVHWEGEVMLLFALAVGDLMTSAFGFLADIDREK